MRMVHTYVVEVLQNGEESYLYTLILFLLSGYVSHLSNLAQTARPFLLSIFRNLDSDTV